MRLSTELRRVDSAETPMKKNAVIISLVSILLLIAAAGFYVQGETFSRRIRPLVVGPISRVLGPDAKLGRVKANLWPLYVEVRDVVVPDSKLRPAVSVRKVRIYLNPFYLIIKRIDIPRIVIIEPRLQVERGRDNKFNIEQMINAVNAGIESSSRGAGRGLSVRSITLRRGGIVFLDGSCSVSNINLEAGLNIPMGSVKASLRSADVALLKSYQVSARVKAEALYSRGRIGIDSIYIESGDAHLLVSGAIGPLRDLALQLKIFGSAGPESIKRFVKTARVSGKGARIRADVGGTLSAPIVNGSVSLLGVSFYAGVLKEADIAFSYQDRELTLSGEGWSITDSRGGVAIDAFGSSIAFSEKGFDIRRFEIAAGDMELHVSGRVDAAGGLDAALDIESRGECRTLSFFARFPVSGRIRAKGVISGSAASPRFDGVLSAWPLTLKGTSFDDVGGKVSYQNGMLRISSIEMRRQGARYILSGSVDMSAEEPEYEARLDIFKSDMMSIVSMFYAEPLPITLIADGGVTFSGTKKDFSGAAKLDLEAGSAYGEKFSQGAISVALTPSRISFPRVSITKGGGTVNASGWISFDGGYSARLEARLVDLSEVDHLAGLPFTGRFSLDMASSGSFGSPAFVASLNIPEIYSAGVSMGGLSVRAEMDKAVLTVKAELSNRRAEIAGNIALRAPYQWGLSGLLSIDNADPFVLLGKRDLFGRAGLAADAAFEFHGIGWKPESVSGTAVLRRLALSLGEYHIASESETDVYASNGRFVFGSINFTGPGTRFSIAGSALVFRELDIAVSGGADLSIARLLYKEIEHAKGFADIALYITDDWSNPGISGRISIREGEVKIKDIPQKFTALSGSLEFDRERIVTDGISGAVGGGTVQVTGSAQLKGLALKDFGVRAAFDDVTVRYPPGLTSTLSGELFYDGDTKAQILSGEVQVKHARYDKRLEWKTMLLDMARGFYQKRKTDIGWMGETDLNIRFFGKDAITFHNNLGRMVLGLDVFLRGTVNQPQVLGRVEAEKGVVYLRKNDFKILHASADFIDPTRMNPVLDIQAETRVREYQVRLAVSGTAERAVVNFISDPPLSDVDILSLLAIGKTASEIKGKEAGVGMGEAASFATGRFQDVFERRARSFTGLDRFQVDPAIGTKDTSVPRITVGKEVVPDRLFVTYSSNVGASAPEQVFRIEYILNKSFSLLGERNEFGNIGADVKFRFEFR